MLLQRAASVATLAVLVSCMGLASAPAASAQTAPSGPVVAVAAEGAGFLELSASGQVTALNGATSYPFAGAGRLPSPAVSIAPAAGGGYYIATSAGNVFPLGAAKWLGSPLQQNGGHALASPVVSIAASPKGGYYVLTAAGNVFNYGAVWRGSPAGRVGGGATSITVTSSGGYLVLTASGQVLNYATPWSGSPAAAHLRLGTPADSITSVPGSNAYYVSTSAGNVFNYGGAPWMGSPAASGVASPNAVGIVPLSGGGYMVGLRMGQMQGFSPHGRSTIGSPSSNAPTATAGPSAGPSAGSSAANALGFYPGDGPNPASYYQSEAAWLGRQPRYVESFLDQSNATNMVGSAGWVVSQYGSIPWHPTLVISVPLGFTGQSPASNFAAISSGAYDAQYRKLASDLASYPSSTVIVRLGWEFDGNWFPWSAQSDPAGFAAAYRHVVGIFRSVSGTKFNFNLVGSVGYQRYWAAAWPGTGYVNTFGVDAYDQSMPVADTAPYSGTWTNPSQAWSYMLSNLKAAESFAVSHGAQMSIGEWGVVQHSHQFPNSQGGDDPTFIQGMYNWANSLPSAGPGSLLYMSYFNNANTQADFRITDPSVPRAAAAFRQLF